MEQKKNKLKKITIGIRYKRSFSVQSQFGEILDFCLEDDFSDLELEKVSQNNNNVVLISEPQEGSNNVLSIGIDDVVLSIPIKSEVDKKQFYATQIDKIKKIFNKFELRNINRVGVVFEYEVEGGVINNIFNIEDPNTTEIRVSKKLTNRKQSLTKTKDSNYDQVILTYMKEKISLLSIDYQTYYAPVISSIEDTPLEETFNSLLKYEEDILKLCQK